MTTAIDSSGNGHNGTYNGAPTLGATGLVTGDADTAVAFDPATNDYTVQNDTIAAQTFTAFTLGCLIKPVATGDANFPFIWGIDGAAGDVICFFQSATGEIYWSFVTTAPSSINVLGSTAISAGTVGRLIGTWDGTTAKLYVNGTLDGSQATSDPVTLVAAEQFYVGAESDLLIANVGFDGVVDECFFVRNHAATAPEIAAIDAAWAGTGSASAAVLALSPYIFWRLGDLPPVPTVDSLSPSTGTEAGGIPVVIAGSTFTGASSVQFGGVEADSFVVDNDSQIIAVNPAHPPGTVTVVVT